MLMKQGVRTPLNVGIVMHNDMLPLAFGADITA